MSKFTVAGVSTHYGVTKVRFANDIVTRTKILSKGTHTSLVELIELPKAMTKAEIKSNVWFTIKWKDGSKDVVEITESSGKVEFYVNGVIDKEVSKEIVGAVVTKKIE